MLSYKYDCVTPFFLYFKDFFVKYIFAHEWSIFVTKCVAKVYYTGCFCFIEVDIQMDLILRDGMHV